ncbi:CU044_5270 family protein [Streptomyces sp. NPDC088387]|uniref:CU044_5270 family protein n=1 Tax=Streptomyces sp. NPDC088387 TaxID=3365859 RepID=UPI0037FDB82D
MNDELELLREWEADAAPLTETARAQARHRLLNTMARTNQHPAAPSPSRRHALRMATAAAVAVAVTGTAVLITADDDGRTGRTEANAPRMSNVAAATVLNGAAAWESRHEKPVVPRDDQFIYSKRVTTVTDRETGKVTTYVDESWNSVDGSQRSIGSELDTEVWQENAGKSQRVWPPQKWSELKRLPTDPEKLISAIVDAGQSPHKPIDDYTAETWDNTYVMLSLLLQRPLLPEGLRPAAYEALAMVPGVKATPGMKDSAGRAGVGISLPTRKWHKDRYFIFDAKSYEFLGFRNERTSGKTTYIQLSHVADWAIVDRARQRP